ncbi:WXG100 family type VII secretion target [Actinophytocola sp. KF-1]
MTDFDVDAGQLHGHAGNVGDIAEALSAIGGRLPSGLADLALGLFARFLSTGLQGAMTQVANSVTGTSSSVAELSTGLTRTAAGYENTDGDNATILNREYP